MARFRLHLSDGALMLTGEITRKNPIEFDYAQRIQTYSYNGSIAFDFSSHITLVLSDCTHSCLAYFHPQGVYFHPQLTTSTKLSPQLGRWLQKIKKLKFTGKAKQGVYNGVFKGVGFKSCLYFVLAPLLHCVLAWHLFEVSTIWQIVVGSWKYMPMSVSNKN